MVLYHVLNEEILTALGHLPEYPTCSKAVCWYGIRYTMNFAGPLSHPSNTVPRPVVGFCFFVIGSGDLRECTLLVRTGCRGFVTADVLEKGLSRGAIATG